MPAPIAYFAKSFGSYAYDDLRDGLGAIEQQIGHRQRMSKAFSRDGAFSDDSLFEPRRVTFTGLLTGAGGAQDAASLRAAWLGFAAAHAPGPARRLQIDSDQYLNARIETVTDTFNGLYHKLSVGFLAFDPFWYSVAVSSLPLTPGGTTALTTAGTAYSWPIFTFTVSAAPAGGLLTLSNGSDTSFSFFPPAAGTYTVNCGAETITDGAGTDQFGGMTGDLPILVAGSGIYGTPNPLTLTTAGGCTLSAASASWQDRWA